MRLLLDHCLPHRLCLSLTGHDAKTAAHMGWETLRNGNLLATAAAAGFDAFITIDKNLKHQQNLRTLPLSVVVILALTNRLPDLLPFVPGVLAALAAIKPGELVEVSVP